MIGNSIAWLSIVSTAALSAICLFHLYFWLGQPGNVADKPKPAFLLFAAVLFRVIGRETFAATGLGARTTMPQSAIARSFLAQFSLARQATDGGWLDRVELALESQRDRLALLVPVGLGFGILLWQSRGDGAWISLLSGGLGLLLITWQIGSQRRLAQVMAIGAILMCAGFAAIMVKSAMVASEPIKKPWIGTFHGRVETVEDVSARGIVRYVLETQGQQGLPSKVRVNVPMDQHIADVMPGAIVQLRARLMPPPGPALPRSYDFARQAWFWGLGATGSALGPPKLVSPATGQGAFWQSQREELARHIRMAMPEGTGGIGAALLVGSRGAITEEDAEALRNSGMAHLLSVSGLHVTAVVGGTFLFVSKLLALFPFIALRLRVPVVAAGCSAVIAVAYTLLTGAEVPTVRACVAALLILAALAMGREALSLRLLAAGACLVLLFWPEALAGPSFQLSFAAVATIVLVHESPFVRKMTGRREEPLLFKTFRFLFSLLITGLAIELVLAPIALFHFQKSGLYGALANIFAIPLTTFFVMPMQILGLLLDSIGAGGPFWWLAGQGVAAIAALAHWVSAAPGAVLMLPSMPRWAFAMIVLGGLWLAIVTAQQRLLGLAPIFFGMVGMALAERPDMLVTGDGRHLAVVDGNGGIVLLRPGAGDYALSMLSENAAIKAEPRAIDAWSSAKCSPDSCTFQLQGDGRFWSVLATRSDYIVPSMELAAACKRADIVISARYLPWSCKPRWLKADRDFLERNGGLAFYLRQARVETVAQTTAHQPWSQLGPKRAQKRPSGVEVAKPRQ
jgi:competence protein ComEC